MAEWLAHWLHMQEVRGSNPGLGMLSFSCQTLKNLTKSGYRQCKQTSAASLLLRLSRKTLPSILMTYPNIKPMSKPRNTLMHGRYCKEYQPQDSTAISPSLFSRFLWDPGATRGATSN